MSKEEMLNLLDVMERRIVYGQPYGDLIDKLRAALSEPKKCKYGDQSCPCQDGDMCHYEGENPMTPPAKLTDEEILECLKEADPKTVRLPIGFKLFARAIERRVAAPPDGYVLVPVEPTEEMRREFEDYYHGAKGYQHNPFKSAYKAMLEAAKGGAT